MATTFSVGVVIVSTTASLDPSTDTSELLIHDFFTAANNTNDGKSYVWHIAETKIVGDDMDAIRTVVKAWADDKKLNLIITTGGTGFAVTDVTPEVRNRASAAAAPSSQLRAGRKTIAPEGSSRARVYIFLPLLQLYF